MKCIEAEALFIRIVVAVISLTGCLWHLADISGIYFRYETDVHVNFEREAMVQLPGVTVCLNSSLTVREDFIASRFPEVVNSTAFANSKFHILGEQLRKLTLREQLYEATMGYREIFNSCMIMKPVAFEESTSDDYINCEQVAPILEYITYSKKCFFLSSQLEKQDPKRYLVDHDTTLRDNAFPLFQIKLNNRFVDRLVVFMQPKSTPFLGFIGGQTNGVYLDNAKYASYTFSYSKTISELLLPPYKTMCRDYSTLGYQTLAHCIVHCKADYFVHQFNGWHADIPASGQFDRRQLDVHYAELQWKENKTLDRMMADECRLKCSKREDCSSEYYSMVSIGAFERDAHLPQYDQTHGIFIYLPSGRNTRYSHSPRLHLIEYICYFASVFSLWFGFSIIAISKALIKAYSYYNQASGGKASGLPLVAGVAAAPEAYQMKATD